MRISVQIYVLFVVSLVYIFTIGRPVLFSVIFATIGLCLIFAESIIKNGTIELPLGCVKNDL